MAIEITIISEAEYYELILEAHLTGEVIKRDGIILEKDN